MSQYLKNLLFQKPRILKYKLLSNNKRVKGKAFCNQPVLLLGEGRITFGKNVKLGYFPSPFFYNGYIHLECRSQNAFIEIGNDVFINNNFFAISNDSGICIGDNSLIGLNCEILDSDFHETNPLKRIGGNPISKRVILGKNVFLGNNVRITKGVELGDHVIVANSSLVVDSFPGNIIIGGVPAKKLGTL